MNNRHKADIMLYSKGYFPLVAFFLFLFSLALASMIYGYIIEKDDIGFCFFLLALFMIIFGGAMIFVYSLFGSRLLVYGNVIEVRRWYGIKKKFDIKSIYNVIFEKSHNEIVSIQIITENSNDKFFDEKVDFERLKEYLIDNVEKDKIKCYLLGTKKEMSI